MSRPSFSADGRQVVTRDGTPRHFSHHFIRMPHAPLAVLLILSLRLFLPGYLFYLRRAFIALFTARCFQSFPPIYLLLDS